MEDSSPSVFVKMNSELAIKSTLVNTEDYLFTFYAVGDYGTPYSRLGELMAMWCDDSDPTKRPKFILSLGDHFYPSGVESVDDSQWDTCYKNVFLRYDQLRVPWKAVLGNHDYRGSVQAQIDYSSHPSNPFCIQSQLGRAWQMPAKNYKFSEHLKSPATVTSSSLASTAAVVDFFALDTNGVQSGVRDCAPGIERELHENIAQLNDALAASTAHWKIVFGHHPMYSRGKSHGMLGRCLRGREYTYDSIPTGMGPFQQQSVPITATGYNLESVLVNNGVAAYLSGHEHVFQHHENNGVHSFVCGASVEHKFYKGESEEQIDWVDRSRSMGFLVVEVHRSELVIRFIGGHEAAYATSSTSSEGTGTMTGVQAAKLIAELGHVAHTLNGSVLVPRVIKEVHIPHPDAS